MSRIFAGSADDDATIDLYGGVLSLSLTASGGFNMVSNGVNGISFEKGVLEWAHGSAALSTVKTYWENGLFTGENGNDLSFTNNLESIYYTQDLGNGNTAYLGLNSDDNLETFVVIPEPATIGLFFMASVTLILLRRIKTF